MDRFKKYFQKTLKKSTHINKKVSKTYKWSINRFEKRPLVSITVILLALFILIILGNFLRTPSKENEDNKLVTKNVVVYDLNNDTQITVQGKIEKSGIVTITAQTGGIVQNISALPGSNVKTGDKLIVLSTNYQGASIPSVQRQLAGTQYQNIKDTYDDQKTIIEKQKELAKQQNENSDKLRDISDNSIDRTEDLVDLNENILDTINNNITTLESSNTNGSNDAAILAAKQNKSQIQSGISQLQASLDSTRFQSSNDNPPAKIADLTQDVAIKQLEIQEKALELSLKTASLQLKIAQIQESLMMPSSPINAVVDRVFVKQGQSITPGTPLMILHGDQNLQLVVNIPFDLSQAISKTKLSKINIGNEEIQAAPTYVSIDVTDGNLATVLYDIPSDYQNKIANNAYLSTKIFLDKKNDEDKSNFVPIDAVHFITNGAILYVVNGNKAEAIQVKLGETQGEFIKVIGDKLNTTQKIILNRNISEGDLISF